jgi:hypothetical protein
MALSFVSLTLKHKIFVNSKNLYNNDEKTDMILIYGDCGKTIGTPLSLT